MNSGKKFSALRLDSFVMRYLMIKVLIRSMLWWSFDRNDMGGGTQKNAKSLRLEPRPLVPISGLVACKVFGCQE